MTGRTRPMRGFALHHKVMRENFETIFKDLESLSLGDVTSAAIEEWKAYDRARGVPPGGHPGMTVHELENLFLEDVIRLGGFVNRVRPELEKKAAAGGEGSQNARTLLTSMESTSGLVADFKKKFREKFS